MWTKLAVVILFVVRSELAEVKTEVGGVLCFMHRLYLEIMHDAIVQVGQVARVVTNQRPAATERRRLWLCLDILYGAIVQTTRIVANC